MFSAGGLIASAAAAAAVQPAAESRPLSGQAEDRTRHYSPRRGDAPHVGEGPRQATAARCELMWAIGGAATVGWELHHQDPRLKIGLMVAANSGRPAGACGLRGRLDGRKLHPGHRTQEEDIVSSWIGTEARLAPRGASPPAH